LNERTTDVEPNKKKGSGKCFSQSFQPFSRKSVAVTRVKQDSQIKLLSAESKENQRMLRPLERLPRARSSPRGNEGQRTRPARVLNVLLLNGTHRARGSFSARRQVSISFDEDPCASTTVKRTSFSAWIFSREET
jgi:hypothetical protein